MHTFWMKSDPESDPAAKSLWKSAIGYGILSIRETIRFKGDDAMRKLEYTFKTDTLFKMLFVQYPELLKKLVADLLGIPLEGIGQFVIRNPEMPPENLGDKFCRLDINMTVNGQCVDLEVQVCNEGDYPICTNFVAANS